VTRCAFAPAAAPDCFSPPPRLHARPFCELYWSYKAGPAAPCNYAAGSGGSAAGRWEWVAAPSRNRSGARTAARAAAWRLRPRPAHAHGALLGLQPLFPNLAAPQTMSSARAVAGLAQAAGAAGAAPLQR
jgi:hypothetical protein